MRPRLLPNMLSVILELHQWPTAILAWTAAYFAIVAVHEAGHYLAGLLVGVPPGNMKIRLLCFPQHVALRDGQEWVSPVETERYIRLAEPYMPTASRALIFVAGGFVVETLGLLLWVALKLPCHQLAISLALMMTLFYFVIDVAIYARTRRAGMDFSALYSISPFWGGLIVVVTIGLQGFLFALR